MHEKYEFYRPFSKVTEAVSGGPSLCGEILGPVELPAGHAEKSRDSAFGDIAHVGVGFWVMQLLWSHPCSCKEPLTLTAAGDYN